MSIRSAFRALLRRSGFDLVRFNPEAEMARRHYRAHPRVRLARFLRQQRIDLVLDVGANSGQYGRRLRQLGYQGRLISFEPSSEAFRALEQRAASDRDWDVHQLALGDQPGRLALNLSQNSQSSSLLPILRQHLDAAPAAETVGSEQVEVQCLDALLPSLCGGKERAILLKLDVQGYEDRVLTGAARSLAQIAALQIELSWQPLYEGAPDFASLVRKVEAHGFLLHALENGFTDPRLGQLLQVDGLFLRPK